MLVALGVLLFAALLIASYRDIRTREVPDTLSYGLITVALLTNLGVAVHTLDPLRFWPSLGGLLAGFGVGMLMYHAKQWGGGDAKLLMGVGAVLGIWHDDLSLLWFLLLLILAGAVYGIATMLGMAIKHRKKVWPLFLATLREPKVHRLRLGLVASGVIILVGLLFVDWEVRVFLLSLLLGVYVLLYAWILTTVIERHMLTKRLPVERLTEGDWLSEDVVVRGKKLIPKENPGITLDQIALLKRRRVKEVVVREGIPFVPAFLLAFIALLALQRAGMLWF